MSERNLRRRTPTSGGGRRIRPPHPSSSSSKLASPSTPRRSGKHYSKPTMVFRRSFSEPMLCGGGRSEGEDHLSRRSLWSGSESEGGVLYRPKTCTDVMVSSTSLTNLCPKSPSFEVFNKEAKVVVNVTVEGSPGPLMIMVKLGCSVEDTIKLVLDKYGKEGRTPKLDKDAASTYELHHSYFCLQGLDKSELLGILVLEVSFSEDAETMEHQLLVAQRLIRPREAHRQVRHLRSCFHVFVLGRSANL